MYLSSSPYKLDTMQVFPQVIFFINHLLCAKPCAQAFIYIMSFIIINCMLPLLLTPFYRCLNWGFERLGIVPEMGRTRHGLWVCMYPLHSANPCPACLPACLPASGKLGGKGLQLPHSRWGNCPDPTSWFEGTPMGEKWDHLSTKKCHGLKSIRGLNPVNNNAAADNNNNNNSNKTHGKNLHLSFGGGWGTNSLLWNLVKRKKKAGGRIKPGASQRARPALPSTPPPFS